MALICFSLIGNGVGHLLTYLLAICTSSLGKCPLSSFAYFVIRFFAVLLLNFMSSLCVLDISSLLEVMFANTFSHSAGGPFVPLTVSLAVQKHFSLM